MKDDIDSLTDECKNLNRKKTVTTANFVKLKLNRKPQFFAKPNQKVN